VFAQDEPKIKLSKVTSFNHYLYAVLIMHFLIYTVQLNFRESVVTNILITSCWLLVGLHAFINESTRQILKKSVIATPEVCHVLAKSNYILSVTLITVATFATGNTMLIFLYLIPVFNSMFSAYKKFSMALLGTGIGLLLTAELTGWLKSDLLIANKDIIFPTILTYTSIIGLLGYLGTILSSQVKHNSDNANMLHNLATTDALTGLLNRREFNRRISEEIARAKRHKTSICLALFDIDHFKKINDTYGHNAGDAVLKELGELISVNTRSCDIAARYGGEEFALILPETSLNEGYELLERLRDRVEKQYFHLSYSPIQATISVGVAQYDFMDSCAADFCERTDKALYQAKRNGRNRVEYATLGMPKLDLSRILVSQSNQTS